MGLRGCALSILLFIFQFSHSQKLLEDKINVSTTSRADNRNAVIYFPKNYDKKRAYPLVLFTHGVGEAGKNVKKLYKQGLPKVLKGGYKPPFDFIMVAVQRNSFSVMPDWLGGILKDCQKRWKIDETRIYLTGLSAGGWAAYGSQLNFSPGFAKKFAAIVINSGVTHNTKKQNFDWWKETKTPLWAIVGQADKGYVGKNAYMVNEINKRVPNLATLTVRPGVGHGGWTEVYNGKVKLDGKNMWEWMYQFKRTSKGSSKPPIEETPIEEENNPAPPDPVTTVKYVKVNIYKGENAYGQDNWNNWNVEANERTNINANKFKYGNGTFSNVHASLSSNHSVVDNGKDYNGGMLPAQVLRYTSYDLKKRTLTIKGLSGSKKYDITLYSSRSNRPGNSTVFSVNNDTRTIATNYNFTNKAVFTNIKPDSKDQIVVYIESKTTYNYLNAFMVTEKTTSTGK